MAVNFATASPRAARVAAVRPPQVTPAPAVVRADEPAERGGGGRLAIVLGVMMIALALGGLADPIVLRALVILFAVGVPLAAVRQPRIALYAVLGSAIFFEAYNGDSLMNAGTLFSRDIQSAFGVPGVQFTLLEVMELVTLVAALAGAKSRGYKLRGGRLFVPAMLFLGMLVFGVIRGQLAGGLFNYAIWEARFPISMIVCYVIAANTIRTRRDIRELLAVFFVLSALFGIESVYRRVVLIEAGLLGPAQEIWYSHEDVIFWAGLMLLVISQQVFGAPRWQRLLGPFVALTSGYAMLVSERRAGMISVILAFAVMTLVFLFVNRKAFFYISVPLIICSAIYLPVFWNATGPFAQPARAVRSINDPDPRDAQSNLSRVLELINIRATIASDPLTGVGFGRPYLLIVPIPDISFFTLWQYETHHNILWIWLKTGIGGFIVFWCLLGGGLARAASYVRRLREPDLRTFALLTIIGIVSSIVYCYVDLGFAGSRIPILLGTLLGGLAILDQLQSPPLSMPVRAR